MMRAWTELLPHVVFAWLARLNCEVLRQKGIGDVVQPSPGVLLRVPADRAWDDDRDPDV